MKLLFSLIFLFTAFLSFAEQKSINVVFVGNSITQGVIIENPKHDAPPARAAENLRKHFHDLRYSNTGISGATTVDYLPENKTLFKNIIAGADSVSEKPIVFSVMIGTNDSAENGPNGSPVSVENYKKNLHIILDTLLSRYKNSIVVLHRPIYYSENTYNGAMYLVKGLNRLKSYSAAIDQLVAEGKGRIFLGDSDAFEYFEKNHKKKCFAENGAAGTFYLHPNVDGAKKLGKFWSDAILRVINN
ncbi:MAG: GDSL-type esterase/lipase family protein [Rikenellaceae bacterium]